MTRVTSLRLDEQTRAALEVLVEREERTASDVIRRLVRAAAQLPHKKAQVRHAH